jgi:hypothetical protein
MFILSVYHVTDGTEAQERITPRDVQRDVAHQ